jgi:AcrR family transcriptional regulator
VNTSGRFLKATCQLLSEQNFSKLSIDRIAERAGLSRRTFFLHFKSKDDALTQALSNLRNEHERAMRELSYDLPAGLTVEDRIQEIFLRILKIIRQPDWRGSGFIRLSGELAELRGHPVHQIIAEAKNDQKRWFERELVNGHFKSPDLLAEQLTIIMTGLLQMQLIQRSPAPGEAVLYLIPLLLSGSPREIPRTFDQAPSTVP